MGGSAERVPGSIELAGGCTRLYKSKHFLSHVENLSLQFTLGKTKTLVKANNLVDTEISKKTKYKASTYGQSVNA